MKIAISNAATIVTTIMIAQTFARITNKASPVIHRSNRQPIATTAEANTIFPSRESRLTAMIAHIIMTIIQKILMPSLEFF